MRHELALLGFIAALCGNSKEPVKYIWVDSPKKIKVVRQKKKKKKGVSVSQHPNGVSEFAGTPAFSVVDTCLSPWLALPTYQRYSLTTKPVTHLLVRSRVNGFAPGVRSVS